MASGLFARNVSRGDLRESNKDVLPGQDWFSVGIGGGWKTQTLFGLFECVELWVSADRRNGLLWIDRHIFLPPKFLSGFSAAENESLSVVRWIAHAGQTEFSFLR